MLKVIEKKNKHGTVISTTSTKVKRSTNFAFTVINIKIMCSEVSSSVDNCLKDTDDFFPTAEELESYYNMLENGNILELEWQCPGRRAPSPDCSSSSSKEQASTNDTTETQEPLKTNDFDFSDDVAQPQMRVRSQNSTPKSVKKITANFAGVMEALKKKNAEGS